MGGSAVNQPLYKSPWLDPSPLILQFGWLDNVDLYITTACDRNCECCMSYDIRKEEGLKHMNKELFFSTMDSLKGIKTVHLAGIGECFQHPDIFELLNYASRKVRDEVRVNTNGYAILSDPESFLRKLPDNIHLYVSFDGYHEDSNYEKSLNLLAKLLEWHGNTDTKITLNMRVESKEEETRNLIERYSRDVFRVSTLHCMMPLGDYFPIIVNRVLKWVRAKI